MSSVSKIPQNRVSRIAGPSKLPSRILRPTFTNKSTSNFVSSAKLVEKKKESVRSLQHSEVEANLLFSASSANRSDGIEEVLHCADNPTVDCNGNKKHSEHKKYLVTQNNISDGGAEFLTVSPNKHSSKSRTSNLVTGDTKYYEMQKVSTVNSLKETDKNIGFQSGDTANSNVQYSKNNSTSDGSNLPNFRSMKPGYFLQKVSALKSSQQKSDGHTEKQSKNHSSNLSRYSATSKKADQHEVNKTKFGYKFDGSTANDKDTIISDQRTTSSASSRLEQFKTELREHGKDSSAISNLNTNRSEKRKKYLELKYSASNGSSRHTTSSNSTIPFGFQKRLPVNDPSSEENISSAQMLRRPQLRKPQSRNAKIARPVVRPKKIPSPITAKPYVAAKSDQPAEQHTSTVKTRPSSYTDSNIINEFLNEDLSNITTTKPDTENLFHSDKLTEKCSDDLFVDSTTSEESGYSSVTSNIYLDIRTNGTEEGSSVSKSLNGQVDEHTTYEEGDTETSSEKQNLLNGQSSYSLSDVLSTELEHDEDEKQTRHMKYCSYIASEDIITFGQYRLQVEGNYSPEEKYGVSEARQIRTSSGSESDIMSLREIQVSPDCENASNSSAETVIHNTRSPQSCDSNDLSDNRKQDNKNDVKFSYTISDIEQQKATSPVLRGEMGTKTNLDILNDGGRCDSQFFSTSDDTLFMTTLRTPETGNKPIGTPSTSSTSKAKKRKTDSLIMSPLIMEETNVKEQDEKEKVEEKKNLFAEDDLAENGSVLSDENDERDESLSEFIDLPSLHESALMIDCNSILEDDNDASSENEAEVFEPKDEEQHKDTSLSATQTNVINKLLCQGLNGIVGSDKTNHSSAPLTNGIHDNRAKAENLSTPLKNRVSAEDNHRAKDDMNNIYRVELGVMKMSLIELYRTLEVEEAQKERQIEENKRLQLKNEKLVQMVENLTKELASLKTSQSSPVVSTKETQVDVQHTDASTDTEPAQEGESTSTSHWFHTEVSTEVESNIKEASEEIKYLKDLRGDFDKRIRDTEERLNSALQLLHR